MPQRIEQSTTFILEKLSLAAKQEVASAQASLAESVVEHAKTLSTREHIQTWLLWGSISLALIIIYGSMMLWAGYGLGMGNMQKLHTILRMPMGIILGGGCFCGGIYLGVYTAIKFSTGNLIWKKIVWGAFICVALGCVFLGMSFRVTI